VASLNKAFLLSRLETTLIDLWCRSSPCAVHSAFKSERGADADFYDVCLEVCSQVHYCPLRFGHGAGEETNSVKAA
jgi:hypothetical protein